MGLERQSGVDRFRVVAWVSLFVYFLRLNQPRIIAQAAAKKSEKPLIGFAGSGATYGSFDFGIALTFFAGAAVVADDAAAVRRVRCGLLL